MAKFFTSVVKFDDSINFSNLPDIALIGPSNAGKSSLINTLARSKIALISNKPGKTRTLNYYDFTNYYLVDTPGYGYSQGSKTDKELLLSILDNYFTGDRPIVGVFQVVSSHGLSAKDIEVFRYLTERFHNYTLLINKIDKVPRTKQYSLLKQIIGITNLKQESILLVSTKDCLNIHLINKKIREYLS